MIRSSSSRIQLIGTLVDTSGELRVVLDGLTKGYILKQLPGQGGKWWWRSRHGACGEANTKDEAVDRACSAPTPEATDATLDSPSWRPQAITDLEARGFKRISDPRTKSTPEAGG